MSFSDLLHSVWQSLCLSMLLQMTLFCSILWLRWSFFSYAKSTHFKKEKCRPLSFIEALHHFKQYKRFPEKRKEKFSNTFFPNILSVVKHFSVKVRTVCLKQGLYQEWRYEQLFHSGSFPSFSSCKFSLSGMLMGNVILFLFAAVLLFWFCLSGMENSTSLRVGVLSTGHLAIAHIFLILITWWQGNQKGTIFQLNFFLSSLIIVKKENKVNRFSSLMVLKMW